MYEITLPRYYNRFSEIGDYKDYKQILFRAGDTIQSAELNELQNILKRDVSMVAKRFIKNGDFLSGGDLVISKTPTGNTNGSGEDTYDWKFNCESGIFFAENEFIEVPELVLEQTELSISEMNLSIGVLFTYQIILEGEDSSLLDPAEGSRNYGRSGAGRLKIIGSFEFNSIAQDEDHVFFEKHIIKNGKIFSKELIEDSEFTNRVLSIISEYDREANGNYVVSGLEPKFVSKNSYLGNFGFQVTEGKVNVNGYKFSKLYTDEIILDELIDFQLTQSEQTIFSVDGNYPLNHSPIRKIFRISGEIEATFDITKGSPGDLDTIPAQYTPVARITSISQGATTYIEGDDYFLDNDKVNWGPAGSEPSEGSSYTISLDYIKTETEPAFSDNNGDINSNRNGIHLEGFKSGSNVSIDYDSVKERVDSLVITSKGILKSIKGTPRINNPLPPRIDEENNLIIANIKLFGIKDPEVEKSGQRVFEFSDIEKILDDLRANEYNLGKIALEMNLSEIGGRLKNSFVDNFSDDNLRDNGYESVGGYIPAMAVNGELTLNIDWEVFSSKPKDIYGFTTLPSDKKYIRLDTIGETLVKSQLHYTKYRKINEYLFTSAPRAKIKVSPELYKWVDRNIFINLVKEVESKSWVSKILNSQRTSWFGEWRSWWGGNDYRKSEISTRVSQTNSIRRSTIPSIIPNITLDLKANNLTFNSNENVKIFWNDNLLDTVSSGGSGELSYSFNIPTNEISGKKKINVEGEISGVKGETFFRAEPLTSTTIKTTTKYWEWKNFDPIAQSFSFNEDTVLNRFRVWFRAAPTTETSLQIVEMTAGYPDTSKTISSLTVPAGVINSDTFFDFNLEDKITVIGGKTYAFIIACEDSIGEVRTARLGERTLDSGEWLTSQVDKTGVFFNSSNNETWTAIQEEDLMFEIYSTNFSNEKRYEFDEISVSDVSDIFLVSDFEVQENSSVEFEINLLDAPTETIFNIDVLRQIKLGLNYTGRILVTLILKSNGEFSPLVNPDIQIIVGKTDITSTYTSVAFDFDVNDVSTVAYIKELADSGANYSIEMMFKQSDVWNWIEIPKVSEKNLDNNWKESKHILDLTSITKDADQNSTRMKINLNSPSSDRKIFLSDFRTNNYSV